MHANQSRLDIQRTSALDKRRKASECLQLSGHDVQERRGEDVHASLCQLTAAIGTGADLERR